MFDRSPLDIYDKVFITLYNNFDCQWVKLKMDYKYKLAIAASTNET